MGYSPKNLPAQKIFLPVFLKPDSRLPAAPPGNVGVRSVHLVAEEGKPKSERNRHRRMRTRISGGVRARV
jgi:hypothetical protein